MNESHFTRIIIQDNQGTTYYSEQETAEYSQMEVQMLRRLRHVGLIQGIEVAARNRAITMPMSHYYDAFVACIATWVSI